MQVRMGRFQQRVAVRQARGKRGQETDPRLVKHLLCPKHAEAVGSRRETFATKEPTARFTWHCPKARRASAEHFKQMVQAGQPLNRSFVPSPSFPTSQIPPLPEPLSGLDVETGCS